MQRAKTHAAPLLCKVKNHICGASPSALMRCDLGINEKRDKCKDCDHFIPGMVWRGFQEGLKKGNAEIEAAVRTMTEKAMGNIAGGNDNAKS